MRLHPAVKRARKALRWHLTGDPLSSEEKRVLETTGKPYVLEEKSDTIPTEKSKP